jgi:hypothetical protein
VLINYKNRVPAKLELNPCVYWIENGFCRRSNLIPYAAEGILNPSVALKFWNTPPNQAIKYQFNNIIKI